MLGRHRRSLVASLIWCLTSSTRAVAVPPVTSPNGDMLYEGEWKDDKKHGQGKVTYSDGAVYEGEWKDGERHGQGKVTYSGGKGKVYEGEWKHDKKHGQGKLMRLHAPNNPLILGIH